MGREASGKDLVWTLLEKGLGGLEQDPAGWGKMLFRLSAGGQLCDPQWLLGDGGEG